MRAFSRTRVLKGPGRSDVDIAMSKWWTKKRPAEGQVRRPLCCRTASLIGIASGLFQYVPSVSRCKIGGFVSAGTVNAMESLS